jgi:hypothetical protein
MEVVSLLSKEGLIGIVKQNLHSVRGDFNLVIYEISEYLNEVHNKHFGDEIHQFGHYPNERFGLGWFDKPYDIFNDYDLESNDPWFTFNLYSDFKSGQNPKGGYYIIFDGDICSFGNLIYEDDLTIENFCNDILKMINYRDELISLKRKIINWN